MKLFGSLTSPFVRHCRIALYETDTDYEFEEADGTVRAQLSPAQKVPFLHDGELHLYDSTAILKYVRERARQDWMADVRELDLYCLANTVLDSQLNLHLLQRSGVDTEAVAYLKRQSARIKTGLADLDRRAGAGLQWHDGSIRLACLIGWTSYRELIDFSPYPNLEAWHDKANNHASFQETAPPPSA